MTSRFAPPIALGAALIALLAASSVGASTPKSWHFVDGKDFAKGELEGVALHDTKGLSVAPKLDRLAIDAEFIHCWTRDGGKLWLGTGLGGKLIVVSKGKAKQVAKLDAALVGALAPDGKGGVYAGLVGKGRIVQVSGSGKVNKLVDLEGVKHVWALLRKGNTLYAGTGPGGAVFAVDLKKKSAKIWAETDTEHVLTLIEDRGALIAGTADAAMLVRIEGEKKARAIANFPGGEVRSVVRHGKALYATVNGGNSAATWSRLKPTPKRPGSTRKKPATKAKKKKSKSRASRGKGAVWVRTDSGRVTRLFVSPEGMLSQLGAAGQGIVSGAARGGRLVVGDLNGDVQRLFDLKEAQILGLEMGDKGPAPLFTGKGAAVYTVGAPSKKAVYTTRVLRDTGVARWGRVETRAPGAVVIESRRGFSDPVGDTWTKWQGLVNERIQSPPATFLQIRARFQSADAHLYEMRIHRRLLNRKPVVMRVNVKRDRKKKLYKVSWRSVDPDGDKVAYTITYRQRGSGQWLMLHDRYYPKTSMMLSPKDMPDGWYEVRVQGTDAKVNSPSEALVGARISKPFLVDQGRPEVAGEVRKGVLSGIAADRVSNIVSVSVSFDGEPPVLARAGDGVFDGLQEAFELRLPESVRSGRHTLLIQASDEAGNTGVQRLTIGGG